MQIIRVEAKAGKDIFFDIRDYGYNAGVKRARIFSDSDTVFSLKYAVNSLKGVVNGIGYEFPIIDGKSPCVFSFKAVEDTIITMFIEELGGIPFVDYFGHFEEIPIKYYVNLKNLTNNKTYKVYLGECETDGTAQSSLITFKSWGDEITEKCEFDYPLSGARHAQINDAPMYIVYSTAGTGLGYHVRTTCFHHATGQSGEYGEVVTSRLVDKDKSPYGIGVYLFIDMTKEKPIYVISSAFKEIGTNNPVLPVNITSKALTKTAYTVDGYIQPATAEYDGEGRQRISNRFTTYYSGENLQKMLPSEE